MIADPWPDQIETKDLAGLVDHAAPFLAQRDEETWSLGFRSLVSRADVRVEDHDGVFVAHVRYEGAHHAPLIGALNAQFAMSWPLDFPVDVAAIFVGFPFEDPARLEELLDAGPWHDPSPRLSKEDLLNLYAWSAAMEGDLDMIERLVQWSTHQALEVRLTIADVAIRRGFDFLVAMMAAEERDDELREQLLERL